MKYDFTKLKLNPEVIGSKISIKGGSMMAKEDIQIIFPSRFNSRGFNKYGETIRILGLFAFVDTEGNYCVHIIPNKITVTPNVTDEVTMTDGSTYTVFTFYSGNFISTSLAMVLDTSFLNDLFNEFVTLGKVPLYYSYTDLIKTFKRTLQFNGSPIGKYNAPIELLVSLIARQKDDRSKPFRYTSKLVGKPGEISWVGLSNVHYAVTSTLSKMAGGHASNAIFSSIGNESELSAIEELILT